MNSTNPISRRSFLARATTTLAALAFARGSVAQSGKAALPSSMELAVDFSIVASSGGRYNRPYVAVWLEDAQGLPIRTLSVWADTGRGRRYLEHLTRWFQDTSGGSDLLSTVSSPTRNPGSYSLVWDGKNDKKAALPQGDYYFCLELAREHGPYTLVREKISVTDKGFAKKLVGGQDIGGIALDYRKRA